MWLKPFFHTLVLLIRQARANHVGPVNKYTLNTFKWIQCKLITAGVISSTVAEYRWPCSTFLLNKESGVERARLFYLEMSLLWISWGRTSMLLAEGWCRVWEHSFIPAKIVWEVIGCTFCRIESDWSEQKCYRAAGLHLRWTCKRVVRWQFGFALMSKRHPHVIKQLWSFLIPRLQGRKADCLWNPWRIRRAWKRCFIDARPDVESEPSSCRRRKVNPPFKTQRRCQGRRLIRAARRGRRGENTQQVAAVLSGSECLGAQSCRNHSAGWLVISDAHQRGAQESRAGESPPTTDSHGPQADGMCGFLCCLSVHTHTHTSASLHGVGVSVQG